MEFGELKDVVLSDVWSDEARDFTPWLADNMDLLSQEIGLPLAWEGTEVPVDGFSADILATTTDGSHVVIENQYGRTDHDHLGKLLTYTAGLEAQIVIWVAERFHDAHLSAIRWLNERTPEPFSFLAVRIQVVQIADSPMVPRFTLLAGPDNWHQRVKENTRTDRLSEGGQFRKEFWESYARRYPNDIPQISATSNQWVYVKEADLVISLLLARGKVGLFLRGNRGESTEIARGRASAFEVSFRSQFDWPQDEPIYDCAEFIHMNTHDRDNWPQMVEWLHDHLQIYTSILEREL